MVRQHKHVAPPTPTLEDAIEYTPDAYLLHLSLAELTLQANPGDMNLSAADFDIARAYSQQKQDGTVLQTVIILDYGLKKHSQRKHIAIPINTTNDTANFQDLDEAMRRLSTLPYYTMQNLQLAVINLPIPIPLDSEGNNTNAALKTIDDRLQPLIKTASALPPMTEARIELQMSQYFMQHEYKEPAYLAIENAQQSLAKYEETTPDDMQASNDLAQQIAAQESLLYKTMPFTFDF